MANLVELFDNIVQMQNLNGVPLAAGKLYVYALGRTRLMDSWSDVDGESLNPNPIILDDAGQAHVYVSDDFDYTLVVCDQYNNEIFSLDKYLYSKGSHSHADVAVAPSESIAVSSYHVGECTVYVPYLTGQLGKVYEGIDPIVVNNQVDKISANHVPLGVQDPLYFVQDDEEGCIIGCSAQTEIPVELSGKWDNASDAVIANSAQWSENTTYEAGSYIDIDNNTISVTGLSPLPADIASTGLVAQVSADITAMIPDTSDMATQTWVNEQGFLTAHQDISNKLDTTAFSTVSGDFLTAIPSEYVTENTLQSGLSSKLDSTAFSTVSGDFLTAHQSLDGLMSADLLEVSDNKITGYNGTAFAGQGGGVIGDYELKEGNGIQLTDDPIAQTTTISVSGDYATNTQLQTVSGEITALIPTALTGEYLDKASADTLYYPLNSNPNGYLTAETDWSDTITAASANAYNEATAAIPTGLATTADLQTVSGEITAMIPSTAGLATEDWVTAQGYITGVDLSPYQTTAGMTAYMTTGDSAEFMTTAERSDYIPTGVSSEFYTTANTANYISEVPDTYLQNTDLGIVDNKVTAISGIPLSAGGDVPEGVMVESGLEYNAVNEISGYNGSAIAQYGAEKQFIVHDDTLVHLSNSAQYALGCNVPVIAQQMGVDETELWSGSANTGTLNLSEPLTSFNEFKFYVYIPERGTNQVLTYYDAVNTVNPGFLQLTMPTFTTGSVISAWWQGIYNINGTVDTATYKSFSIYANGQYYKQCSTTACGTNDSKMVIKKIIGVGKKV